MLLAWEFGCNMRTSKHCGALWEASLGDFVEGATLQLNDVPKYYAALQHRKMLPSEHALSDPFTSELVESYLKPLGITSLLDAPILVAGRVAGVVCHEHIGIPREWTTEERDFAASIADLLGTKLRVAELHQLRSMLELSEDRLIKLERSDALAKMALGVAHDFRNILTAIGNCAEILAKKESQENLASISVIQQACSRGVHLIRHLAEFGKNSPGHPEVVSIRSIIEKFMPILRMAVGSSHQIDLQIDPSPGKLLIDSDELLRALINLIVNAKEAMPSGGTIDLRVLPWKKSRQFGSGKLAIEVRDHGCGMSDATLQQLFDPFLPPNPMAVAWGCRSCSEPLSAWVVTSKSKPSLALARPFVSCYRLFLAKVLEKSSLVQHLCQNDHDNKERDKREEDQENDPQFFVGERGIAKDFGILTIDQDAVRLILVAIDHDP